MLTLSLLLACSAPPPSPPTPPADPGAPVDGDMLVIAGPFDPGNLNPLVAPYAFSGVYIDATQPGLAVRYLGEDGLAYRPGLAESWRWSQAGDALTYTLREGLVWDDGAPLTADDVAFTYALIADPAVASNWFDDARQIAEIEVEDSRTVTFRFHAAGNPALLQGTTIRGIVPQHILADADRATLRGNAYSRAPSASGPWRLARWEPEALLVLEPNPAATAFQPPHLERVMTKIIPEYATRLIELQNGSVDLMLDVQIHDLAQLHEQNPNLVMIRQPAASMQYIGWNTLDPRFSDPSVRRAMTLAVDLGKLTRDLLSAQGEVYAQPCVGTVGPNLSGWYADDIAPLPHDPAAARALLAAAGWRDGDGDGVLERNEAPFEVQLIVQNGEPQLKDIAVSVQAQLRAVGVDLRLQLLEPNRFAQLAREHDFQAILWSFGNNPKVDPFIQWHSEGQYNWMGFSDPEVDRLIVAARAETDLTRAQALIRQVQALVYAAQPATFLFWQDQVNAIDGRFRAVEMNSFTFLEQLERWWVPAAEQRY